MKIKVLVTGGTFDKEYNELDGRLFFKETHVPEMLKLGRCNVRTTIEKLMMIDSLEMEKKDRIKIAEKCQAASEDRIVITHGTDTMVETAKMLAQKIHNKTVVLTGAMVPYKFGSSDGLFNLGSAISFAQVLPYGIYIAMNGKYFHWNNVRKNRKKGEFEAIK